MPTYPVRVVASLFACVAGLVAADDVTMTYTYEDLATGRDIHEGIYGSQGTGEFDEWRIHLGLAPGIDRIQVKGDNNGTPYPGPKMVESDKVINDPALPHQVGLTWLMGDYVSAGEGWFVTLGLEYTWREYSILYADGTESTPLKLKSLAAHVGLGYAWYLNSRVRYEFEPFVSGGAMWTHLAILDPATLEPTTQANGGAMIEGGLRNALIWHPARTQVWHLGVALDYRTGYGQSVYSDSGVDGTVRSEARFYWYGFSGSLFYGHKF